MKIKFTKFNEAFVLRFVENILIQFKLRMKHEKFYVENFEILCYKTVHKRWQTIVFFDF